MSRWSDVVVGQPLGDPVMLTWTAQDSMLYSLAVGAGQVDPAQELAFSTDNTHERQRALPTFAATVSGRVAVPALLALLDGLVDPAAMLHGDQSHEQVREFPVAGSAIARAHVAAVWDKGAATVVQAVTELAGAVDGEPLAVSSSSMFFRGAGGWGGERGPSAVPAARAYGPVRRRLTVGTRPDQPLLYRLTGDSNPLHTDPQVARRAGFPRPIMHGMCVYGAVGRVLLGALAGGDPSRFVSLSARFARTVLPGESLTVVVREDTAGTVDFDVDDPHGDRVLSSGTFLYRPGTDGGAGRENEGHDEQVA